MEATAKRILIAGCGDIGLAVGTALVKQGYHVTGLRRSLVCDESGIDYVQADLTIPETLQSLPTGYDLVLAIVTPSERSLAGYQAIYVDGVGNLLQHLVSHGAKPPVIYISSTRVYGQTRGEWVNEDSETVPSDEFGRILLAAERQVLDLYEGNSVVRFSGIYGRGEPHMLRMLQSKQPVQNEPPMFTNRVHKDDCVGALLFLMKKRLEGEDLDPYYLVSDDDPASKWDVLCWLASQKGLPRPTPEVSTVDAGQGKRCSNERICSVGYSFKYSSFREGYSDLLSG